MIVRYTQQDIQSSPYTNLTPFSTASIIHAHTFWEFSLVLNGVCRNKINGGEYTTLTKGSFFCIRPVDYHQLSLSGKSYLHRDFYVTVEKMQRICSIFSNTFYDELIHDDLSNFYPINVNDFSAICDKANILHQVNSYSQEFIENLHTVLIIELLGIMIRAKNRPASVTPPWIEELFIELSNIKSFDYTIDELCANTGYSHSYVCKTFKKYYNTTLNNVITKNKISYSAYLLGTKKIIDISILLGWENPKNYSIEFKKVFGVTPSQYIIDKNLKRQPILHENERI